MSEKLAKKPDEKYEGYNCSNYAYLIYVDVKTNKNKFFEISENSNSKDLLVHYGKVGTDGVYKEYKASEGKTFKEFKTEKENKGYEDKTALFANKSDNKKYDLISSKPVDDVVVQKFLEEIIKASEQFMKENYEIEISDVTPKMVAEADRSIDELNKICDCEHQKTNPASLYAFNCELTKLFGTIPRSMKNVSDNFAHSMEDCNKIIKREMEMLENVKGILKNKEIGNTADKENKTILEMYNLQAKRATYKQEDDIIAHLGKDYNGNVERRFIRAFAVENIETRRNFEQYKLDNNITPKQIKLFYHGSKMENWFSIYSQGLSLNPDAVITGKMFGQGLYFAPECRKALNYMNTKGSRWCEGAKLDYGYTAVYSVAVGTPYEPERILGSSFTKDDLPSGCQSVFASKKNDNLGLKNDEYIVYNQDACTIKYMLEMKSPLTKDLEFNLDRKNLKNSLIDHTSCLMKVDDNKFRTEIFINQIVDISEETQNAFNQIITTDECKNLFMEYDTTTDKIQFIINDNNDTEKIHKPNITNDDYKFIMREMKKNFANGEYEWELAIQEGKNKEINYIIPTINGTNMDMQMDFDKEIILEF